MLRTFLKTKIHRATVTQTDLNYNGSISISNDLLEKSGIAEFEQVGVYNITNGARFTTYALKSEEGSGVIGVNGAGARLASPGDLVIICAYAILSEEEIGELSPTVILVDEDNRAIDE